MSKYDPFARYLRSQSALELTIALTEIERIIGGQLPRSARERPEWWWNDLTPYRRSVQSRSWVSSGYLARVINFEEQQVTFRKRTFGPRQRGDMVPRSVTAGRGKPALPMPTLAGGDA